MIMLKEYLGKKELEAALELTQGIPELLFIHHSIKNYYMNHYPCNELRIFSYPFENPIYWFLVDLQKNACPAIHLAQNCDFHDRFVFLTAATQFLGELEMLVDYKKISISTELHLIHDLSSLLHEFFSDHQPVSRVPFTVFYMSDDQIEDCNKLDVTLPYGFTFSKLDVSEAAKLVHCKTNDDSIALIGDRIRYLPSVCIRHANSGDIVTHELCSSRGDMLNLYTHPDNRRQGLASAAEIKLAQRIIRENGRPFKAVPNHLTSIILSSEGSPFWTIWSRSSTPVQFTVTCFEKC
ncbi:unnamed protein product [Auanema sp. JU1783]|nr:unnamed protein product [Auanema sp. JU1783]